MGETTRAWGEGVSKAAQEHRRTKYKKAKED